MREVKRGFTMVELSLSIAFIAILSIIVLVIISNAVSAYHRGLTLNQLNTAGMDIVEEMRKTVQSSPARPTKGECTAIYNDNAKSKKCEGDNGLSFVYIERYADIKIGSKTQSAPVYGAFCTGSYSYLWNSGYFFNDEYKMDGSVRKENIAQLVYKKAGEKDSKNWRNISGKDFKLLKVQDDTRAVCKNAAAGTGGDYLVNNTTSAWKSLGNTFDISSTPIEEDPIELLEGNNNLAIYNLTTALPAESGNSQNMFYSVSFVLGTLLGGINVKAAGNYCTTPEDFDSSIENFDYCAINKFNFAAQATGG